MLLQPTYAWDKFREYVHEDYDRLDRSAKGAAALLSTLIGAIDTKQKTFNPARPLTEAEVIAEVKKLLDGVIETGRLIAGNPERADRAAQIVVNDLEQSVLEAYMPQQMTEAEIEAFATERKAEGCTMGLIMAALKAVHPGQYDGKLASTVVKRVLA